MDSSPLSSLPTELISRILDFIEAREYLGFFCTCREAVTIVKRQLDNSKDKGGQYLDWAGPDWAHFDDSKALRTQLPLYRSRTSRHLNRKRRIELQERLQEAQWAAELGGNYCTYEGVDDTTDL
jgi:hypothetical protein